MADGLGALAVRWTPRSSFPLRWSRRLVLPQDLGAHLAQPGISRLEALASPPGWWPTRESNPEIPLRRRGSVRRSRRPSGPRWRTPTSILGLGNRCPSVGRSGEVVASGGFNLHSGFVARGLALAYEGMVVTRGIEPRPRASEAREIVPDCTRRRLSRGWSHQGASNSLSLLTGQLRSGALVAMVTSRGIEPRSLGLQPSAMTTLARWSKWSRRRESNPRLRLTRAPCCR